MSGGIPLSKFNINTSKPDEVIHAIEKFHAFVVMVPPSAYKVNPDNTVTIECVGDITFIQNVLEPQGYCKLVE